MSFANPTTSLEHFRHLQLENTTGVTFATTAVATGQVDVAAGAGPVTGTAIEVQVGTGLTDPSERWQVPTTRVVGSLTVLPSVMTTTLRFSLPAPFLRVTVPSLKPSRTASI